jgi:hypothetical protein
LVAVGSMLPSNEASGLLSPSMIISGVSSPPIPSPPGTRQRLHPGRIYLQRGKDPQSLKPYEKRAVCREVRMTNSFIRSNSRQQIIQCRTAFPRLGIRLSL